MLNELPCNEWSDTDASHESQVVEGSPRPTLVDKPRNGREYISGPTRRYVRALEALAYHKSAIDAGTSPSIGAIQKPAIALDATKEVKVFAAEAQNAVATRPTAVAR